MERIYYSMPIEKRRLFGCEAYLSSIIDLNMVLTAGRSSIHDFNSEIIFVYYNFLMYLISVYLW